MIGNLSMPAENINVSPLLYFKDKQKFAFMLLGILVLCSAISVVYVKHIYRGRHIELQRLQIERDTLHAERTQLLLEQGTWGSDLRVEKVAREKLGMIIPPSNQVVVIKP